jgi:cell division protein FtsB
MEIEHKPWEWTTVVKDGSYNLVRADEETRKKQLEEYKKRRREELKREMNNLEEIF